MWGGDELMVKKTFSSEQYEDLIINLSWLLKVVRKNNGGNPNIPNTMEKIIELLSETESVDKQIDKWNSAVVIKGYDLNELHNL